MIEVLQFPVHFWTISCAGKPARKNTYTYISRSKTKIELSSGQKMSSAKYPLPGESRISASGVSNRFLFCFSKEISALRRDPPTHCQCTTLVRRSAARGRHREARSMPTPVAVAALRPYGKPSSSSAVGRNRARAPVHCVVSTCVPVVLSRHTSTIARIYFPYQR